MHIHGSQLNPYRYMKNAKLLLLPSYHEAAPMVFQEAIALEVPILTTDTTSAMEMVVNQGAGWVCGFDDESIYCSLKDFCSGKLHISTLARVSWGFDSVEQFKSLMVE